MLSKNRARAYLRCLFIPVPDRHLSRDLLSVLEHSGHLLERCDRYDAGNLYFWPRVPTIESYLTIFRNPEIWSAIKITVADRRRDGSIHLLHHVARLSAQQAQSARVEILLLLLCVHDVFRRRAHPNVYDHQILGLIDSFWVYIFPGLIGVFLMILVRTFMEQIPGEIEESSKIDGANDLQTFFRIIMPLCVPVLATIGLFLAIGH